MRLVTPSLLDSYTGGQRDHDLEAGTADEALEALDARYPGLRFRVIDENGKIRHHINVFVDGALVRRLDGKLRADSVVHVMGALSGG